MLIYYDRQYDANFQGNQLLQAPKRHFNNSERVKNSTKRHLNNSERVKNNGKLYEK